MEIDLKRKQSTFFGITGDSHTLADDIQPLSDEKAGEVASPRSTSQLIMYHDIFLNIPAGCRCNPRLPAVSLPLAAGVSPASADLGSKFSGMPSKLTGTVKPNKSARTANLASSNAAGGNNRLKPSLYTLPIVKTGISETMTAYNQYLRGLTLWGGQVIPCQRGINGKPKE